jgi:hypothetical protein
MINRQRPEWVPVFTGLTVRQFASWCQWWRLAVMNKLRLDGDGACRWLTGFCWWRSTTARIWRNRQVAALFGILKSAAEPVVDHLAPLLALAPIKRAHGPDTVLIVDGTLVSTHDRQHV